MRFNWTHPIVKVLALFEICAHPKHSASRAFSAMTLLDSLIHGLSLTLLDADDADTSVFLPRSVPTVPQKATWTYDAYQVSSNLSDANPTPNCGCQALTLASNWALTNEYAPLWGHAPGWHATWSVGEIRKESCRRLCWSSMSLAAGHVSYMSACRQRAPELFISNPANVRNFVKSRVILMPMSVCFVVLRRIYGAFANCFISIFQGYNMGSL